MLCSASSILRTYTLCQVGKRTFGTAVATRTFLKTRGHTWTASKRWWAYRWRSFPLAPAAMKPSLATTLSVLFNLRVLGCSATPVRRESDRTRKPWGALSLTGDTGSLPGRRWPSFWFSPKHPSLARSRWLGPLWANPLTFHGISGGGGSGVATGPIAGRPGLC